MGFDELFRGGPVFSSGDGVFAPGTDAVVLSDFMDVRFAKRICDIGCGCGVLSVCAAIKSASGTVTAVDVQNDACLMARANIEKNGLSHRINVLNEDIRDYKSLFPSGSFDCIVSNPPYFPVKSGDHSQSDAIARQEIKCTLKDLLNAVCYLLKYGGYFYLVHRADRSCEVITALSNKGLEPKTVRFVQHNVKSEPSLVLIKCKKGGKSGVNVLPTLILYNEDGTKSDELVKIYNREGWENER